MRTGFDRGGSGAYWDSGAWDPDDRVYVGASDGQHRHHVAVDEEPRGQPPGQAAGAVRNGAPKAEAPELPRQNTLVKVASGHFWDAMEDSFTVSTPVHSSGGGGGRPGAPPPGPVAMRESGGHLKGQPKLEAGEGLWEAADYGAALPPGALPTSPPVALSGHSKAPAVAPMASRGAKDYWAGYEGGARTSSVSSSAPPDSSPAASQNADKGTAGINARQFKVVEVSSDAYWHAGCWDPDERIYVGAEGGGQHHLTAVDPNSNDTAGAASALSRAWRGGLVCTALGLGEEVGGTVDLRALMEEPPTLKDQYEMMERSVGAGSFGVVRPAKHRHTGISLVVKAVKKTSAGDLYRTNLVDKGLGEGLLRMSRDFPHPNIAYYYDMLEGPAYFYVIMEELKGPELLQYVEDTFPVTESVLQVILKQVLGALAHLHDKVGIYHRDVKLTNFRFRGSPEESSLVLIDFGFAGLTTWQDWDGAVCGTMMFMAPELVASKAVKPHMTAMDVWAVGVILYVLLTGDSPFTDVQVKEFGRPGALPEDCQGMLEDALVSPTLAGSSLEAIDLLRQLLVINPRNRITAGAALRHRWFTVPGGDRQVNVSKEKYRSVRSSSRILSEMGRVPSRKFSGMLTPTKLGGDEFGADLGAGTGLERIISAGSDEVAES